MKFVFKLLVWTVIQYCAISYMFSDGGKALKCEYDEQYNEHDFHFLKMFLNFSYHTFYKDVVTFHC
jgi:hypothetical protein